MIALRGTLNLVAVIWFHDFLVNASPIVIIKNGTLEGTVMKAKSDREFLAFRGIPYALPPVDELRFQPPQPAASWTGVRSAKEDVPLCTQSDVFTHQEDVVGSEDCLYLNVYTPRIQTSESEESQKLLPVMVWIHGGAWISGSANSVFFSPKYILDHDVVLVAGNYRLGAIGFLSTQDMVAPGNLGMKDQVQVLRWVQENIAAFGGDPNSVTIFGESAGAASVHHHIMSPLSRGLFHRAISQSGSALTSWAITKTETAKKHAQRLAKHLGCPVESSSKLVSCLKTKEAKDIIDAEKIFQVFHYDPAIPFRVVVEPDHPGAFLNKIPAEALKSGDVADVPWMTGLNAHEGALKVSALYGLKGKNFISTLNEKWSELAMTTLIIDDICPEEFQAEVSERIREFYFGNNAIDESSKWNLTDMYSDAWFSFGIEMSVRHHLEVLSSPVYYYYFSYQRGTSFSTVFGDPEGDYGVCHCDEMKYLFPIGEMIFPNNPLDEEEHEMVEILTSLWYNFAKSGNPTPEKTLKLPLKWKPVRTDALEYLAIENPHSLKMSRNLNQGRMEFWKTLPHLTEVLSPSLKLTVKDEL